MGDAMLTAITPTGDRFHQFEICYELLMRQTVKPDRWIIIDDGVKKLEHIVDKKINNMDIIVIRREASPERITLKDNILAALEKININDKILFIEDDDFYPSTYIEAVSELLNDYTVVGGLLRKYYNLYFRGHWEFKRPMFGTLNSTAFNATEKTLKILYEICLSNADGYGWDIDFEFWKEVKSANISNVLHSDARAQVIGVKGWNIGREGIIVKTHRKSHRKYLYDADFNVLENYFGDLSEKYKTYVIRGFPIDLWRPSLGAYYRLRAALKSRVFGPL